MERQLRALGAIVTGLSMVTLVGGSVLASHHLPNEGGSKGAPAKVIVIEPAEHTMLVQKRIRLVAQICNADLSGCKPARKAKWRLKPRSIAAIGQKRGAVTIIDGTAAGTVVATAKQAGVSGSATITVNPAPMGDATGVAADDLRLYVEPEEKVVGVGDVFVLTAWGCPLGGGPRRGGNGVADGIDDGCLPVDIDAVNVDAGAPVSVLVMMGPAAALRLDGFPTGVEGDLAFIGAQVVTDIGSTLPSLQASSTAAPDPLFYDMNMDGVVDADDHDILSGSLPLSDEAVLPGDPSYTASHDLTRDGRIDRLDGDFFRALAPDAAPEPADPFELMLEELDDDIISGVEGALLVDTIRAREPAEPGSGDVDRNRVFDATDVLLVRRMVQANDGLAPTQVPIYDAAADVDGDGDVDLGDLDEVIRKSAPLAEE